LIVFKDDKAEIFAGIYVNGMRGSGACDVDAYAVFVRLHVVCINTFHCCIISNVFDKYDPPNKSYNDRLETIKKAKLEQAKIQEEA